MARTSKANTNKTTDCTAVFTISGTIESVYEGKNKNYIDIKINRDEINPKTKQPYYSTITVSAAKEIELYDDGTFVTVKGNISSFFDKNIERTKIILSALTIEEVSNS